MFRLILWVGPSASPTPLRDVSEADPACPQRSPPQCRVAPFPGPCLRSVEAAGTRDPRIRAASRGSLNRYWEIGAGSQIPWLVSQAPGPHSWTFLPTPLPAFQGKDSAAFSHLEDPRQCALCLKYGDADSKVRATA